MKNMWEYKKGLGWVYYYIWIFILYCKREILFNDLFCMICIYWLFVVLELENYLEESNIFKWFLKK